MSLWSQGWEFVRALRTVDFEDPFKRQRTEFYITLCLSSMIGMLPTFMLVPFATSFQAALVAFAFPVGVITLCMVGIAGARRGYVDLIAITANVITITAFLVVSIPNDQSERLGETNMLWGIPFIVILAAPVLKPGAILLMGAVAFLHLGVYAWFTTTNWQPDPAVIIVSLFLFLCTFTGYILSGLSRKNLQSLHRQNQELEEARRLADQKRAEAEDANAAKSLFLANISHELRTPLTTILGYSELVLEEIDADVHIREDVDHIERSGKELLTMIDDLLDLSTLEAGTLTPVFEEVSLTQSLHTLADKHEPHATRRGNALHLEVPQLDPLHTDPRRVSQIVDNLLSNAVKFTRDGRVELRAHQTPTHQLIEVVDTGPGMTPEKIARALDPFSQSLSSVHADHRGLGLSLSHRMAELLGGELTLESEPGVGTTARVRLPRQ